MTTSEAMQYLKDRGVTMSRPTFMKLIAEHRLSTQADVGCNHRINSAKLDKYVSSLLGEEKCHQKSKRKSRRKVN